MLPALPTKRYHPGGNLLSHESTDWLKFTDLLTEESLVYISHSVDEKTNKSYRDNNNNNNDNDEHEYFHHITEKSTK